MVTASLVFIPKSLFISVTSDVFFLFFFNFNKYKKEINEHTWASLQYFVHIVSTVTDNYPFLNKGKVGD